MRNTELFQLAKDTFNKCLSTLEKKNQDYSNIGIDSLRNFKTVEFFQLTDRQTGVLVRICDKFMRICNLFNSKGAVDESVEDTIDDMINYLIILKACREDSQKSS